MIKYKSGNNAPKKKGNMLTIVSNMENNRWYTKEELYQLAEDLNINRSTIDNLCGYGIQRGYIVSDVPETEETTSCAEDSSNISVSAQDERKEKPENNYRYNFSSYLKQQIADYKKFIEQELREVELFEEFFKIQQNIEKEQS